MACLAQRIWELEHYLCQIEQVGKKGVPDRVVEALQRERPINVKIEVASLDSTIIKVHPDGTGAFKKVEHNLSGNPEADGQPKSYGCREC